jgi:hypothetical protein
MVVEVMEKRKRKMMMRNTIDNWVVLRKILMGVVELMEEKWMEKRKRMRRRRMVKWSRKNKLVVGVMVL